MSYGSVIETFPGYNELLVIGTINELRYEGVEDKTNKTVCMVQGKVTFDDGLGKFFIWSPTSTETDDGVDVVKPISVTTGRWLSFNRNI